MGQEQGNPLTAEDVCIQPDEIISHLRTAHIIWSKGQYLFKGWDSNSMELPSNWIDPQYVPIGFHRRLKRYALKKVLQGKVKQHKIDPSPYIFICFGNRIFTKFFPFFFNLFPHIFMHRIFQGTHLHDRKSLCASV